MPIVKTPAKVLYELSVEKKWPRPKYIIKTINDGKNFAVELRVETCVTNELGFTKHVAKNRAALSMLNNLKRFGEYHEDGNTIVMINKENEFPVMPENAISALMELCSKINLPEGPKFVEKSAAGPSHRRLFVYECYLGSLKSKGKGFSKKQAKQSAARQILKRIEYERPSFIRASKSEKALVKQTSKTVVEQVVEKKTVEKKMAEKGIWKKVVQKGIGKKVVEKGIGKKVVEKGIGKKVVIMVADKKSGLRN